MAYDRAELRTLIRQRADMENSTFIGDTELNNYIQDSVRALHDKLIAACGQQFGWAVQTIATTAGDDEYSLANDFYRLLRVDILDGDYSYPLERWDPSEIVRDTAQRNWLSEARPRYRMRLPPGEIVFIPPPDGVYTIEVHYHIAAPTLDDDTDDTAGIFDEWIILDGAIKCRTKEETDVGQLQSERAIFEQRIDAWARQFDHYKPAHIIDARSTEECG